MNNFEDNFPGMCHSISFYNILWTQFIERLKYANVDDLITFVYNGGSNPLTERTVSFVKFYEEKDGSESKIYAIDSNGIYKYYLLSKISWPIFNESKKICVDNNIQELEKENYYLRQELQKLEKSKNEEINFIEKELQNANELNDNERDKNFKLQEEIYQLGEENIYYYNENEKLNEDIGNLKQQILLTKTDGWEVI